MFQELKESITQREERVLRLWQESRAFEQSVERREGCKLFSFYDGPPFATGLPHYGHLLAGTMKDVVPRYKTMQGYKVPRRFGWDCHGLPVEYEVEKRLQLSGPSSIEAFGIDRFNEECRSIVLRYTDEWQQTVLRAGRWVDFNNTYRTMDPSFMESVWWVFKRLWDLGLVYEGYKVMPFSTKLGTPLSNFEASENYKEVDDPSLVVAFPVPDSDVSLLAWTTTPWTLTSNLALMVGPAIAYSTVQEKSSGRKYILAQERVGSVFTPEEIEVLGVTLGAELIGVRYEPPFDYFKQPGAFRVIAEDSVSVEEGTGLVHSAPAFGEVDFYACKREGITPVCPVDSSGCFTIPQYAGLHVKEADKKIIAELKAKGRLLRQGTVRHRYPFCWRSDTPLIYRAVTTWFVAVEKIKSALLKANDQIHWVPEHMKEGRFGKWLAGARDWAVSRNRYWGTPIPIWRSDDGEIRVMGSIAELEEKTGKKISDIHRHFIDDLTFTDNGKVFRRIPEVFDCWFESGAMPYAQEHYPFEKKAEFESGFPADFIAEGADQTRGWFYTLTVLAAALFDKPAFKNVIVNGIILAADGQKMSKRLKNYPEPDHIIERFGADAMRLYLLQSPAVRADDLRFSEKGVELTLRQVLIPLWNSYSFLATYARIYHWQPKEESATELIDRWILSKVQTLVEKVTEAMDGYRLSDAVPPLVDFVEQVTNWYIRRCRERFWADEDSADRRSAFATLYSVLKTAVRVAAPFIPFLTEAIWQELRQESEPLSVHWTDFPKVETKWQDRELEAKMALLQQAVSLGHGLRKEHQLKVRQPLPKLYLAVSHYRTFFEEQFQLIEDELNVKKIEFVDNESSFITYSAKPNFKTLGKKVGKLMPLVQRAVAEMPHKQLVELMAGKGIELHADGEPIWLTPNDITIERHVKEGLVAAHEEGVTIALDTQLTPELIEEGIAREIRNKINTMRREASFAVTDRIHVGLQCGLEVRAAFERYQNEIMADVLCLKVAFEAPQGTQWDINGYPAVIQVTKV